MNPEHGAKYQLPTELTQNISQTLFPSCPLCPNTFGERGLFLHDLCVSSKQTSPLS